MYLLFVIGFVYSLKIEERFGTYWFESRIARAIFVISLFTGSVFRELATCNSHGTMSSEDQLYKDILKLNVAKLQRELEKSALPATGRKAELIQRLYKFAKRELITSQGGSPEDSVQSEKSQDKTESILKTPSRIPRLLPNVEEISKSARSRLDRTSSICDRNRILEQDLFEDRDIALFGHSRGSDGRRDEGKIIHEQLHDNGQQSWEHNGQTTQTGQLSNTGQPRFQVSSDEPKYETDF